ncbi:MAG: RagB/SusD family nutrient uptake outer membrane protein, partial [Bacteroidota bacterium]
HRLIRLADIKLLYAEALHHNGNDPDALQQVQDVRNRVGLGASPFTAEGVAKVIEWERILELSGESQRFFDMMRYGYFDGTGGAEFDIVKIKIRDPEFNSINLITKGYLPIPTRELDLNEGIEQNLGW